MKIIFSKHSKDRMIKRGLLGKKSLIAFYAQKQQLKSTENIIFRKISAEEKSRLFVNALF